MINEFLQEIRLINWFEHSKKVADEYYVIHSIFEAYDDWNKQMLETWELHICLLENIAVEKLGNEQIDKNFSNISLEISDILWEKWGSFILRFPCAWIGDYPDGKAVVL